MKIEDLKRALNIAIQSDIGFEGNAKDAAGLLSLITGLEARIAELEKQIETYANSNGLRNKILQDIVDKQHSRIAELEAERRWIPVSERLPDENIPVLVLTVLGGMFVDFIHGKNVVTGKPDFYELDIEDITHWMPLPTPPEVQE